MMNTENPIKTSIARAAVPPNDVPVAYIKAFVMDGKPGFAVYVGSGEMIGWCNSRDIAFAAATQHELFPVSVH